MTCRSRDLTLLSAADRNEDLFHPKIMASQLVLGMGRLICVDSVQNAAPQHVTAGERSDPNCAGAKLTLEVCQENRRLELFGAGRTCVGCGWPSHR